VAVHYHYWRLTSILKRPGRHSPLQLAGSSGSEIPLLDQGSNIGKSARSPLLDRRGVYGEAVDGVVGQDPKKD
jgi:hypothetical protein